MLVTIYYTDGYAEAPSAVERIATPEDLGWSRSRAHFRRRSAGAGEWCLAIEKYQSENGGTYGWYHSEEHCPLRHACESREEYFAWLAETVMAVYVDGAPYWINPAFAGDDAQDNVQDTEHGFTGGD